MFTPGDYLHPRYWLSWFGFGLLRLISLLPLPAIALLGSALGTLVFHLMKPRRQIAVQTLRLVSLNGLKTNIRRRRSAVFNSSPSLR